MSFPPIDPIDPLRSDAAEGSVFTHGRRGMPRWTPAWGGKPSLPDLLLIGALILLVIFAALVWFVL